MTSKWRAEHPFTGQKTQHSCLFGGYEEKVILKQTCMETRDNKTNNKTFKNKNKNANRGDLAQW